jgi:hypothetical protein
MPRYKGRPSPKEIKKDFPHTVEMRVPLGGFGSKLNAMHQWHEARGIRAIHSAGRRDENKRDYIRLCFADPIAAKDFCPLTACRGRRPTRTPFLDSSKGGQVPERA